MFRVHTHTPHALTASGSTTANLMNSIYGWLSMKRGSYASDFHIYAMEWTGSWMRFYVDDRLQATVQLPSITSRATDSYFWDVAKFPTVAMNMSSGKYIVVEDPWASIYGGSAAAPFDQRTCGHRNSCVSRYSLVQNFTSSWISRWVGRVVGSLTRWAGNRGWTGLPVRVALFCTGVGHANTVITAAMRDFAAVQDTWSATWLTSPDQRAFRV